MRRMAVAVATAMLSLGFVVTTAPGFSASASSFDAEVRFVASGGLGYRVPNPAAYALADLLRRL